MSPVEWTVWWDGFKWGAGVVGTPLGILLAIYVYVVDRRVQRIGRGK